MRRFLFCCAFLGLAFIPARAYALAVIPFEGMIDLKAGRVTFQVGSGMDETVILDVVRRSPEAYRFTLDLKHVQTGLCDIATEVQGDIALSGPSWDQKEMSGEVESKYTLLNRRPVRDLYLKFAVRDRKFIVSSLWIGSLSGRGEMALFGDHAMNASFELLSAELEEVTELFHARPAIASNLSGVVSASAVLTGPASKPNIRGKLAAYNGRLKALEYESILLDFDGVYPKFMLNDSTVTSASGMSFRVEGPLDLSDVRGLPEQIKGLKKTPIIAESENRREWVFKRLHSDSGGVTEMK
ncbi:MAG: hypothetical protein HQL19_05695, partial [Candidatus Omnitrophica bacterium]|nr:hypothetical protein [Candidatus Omnitrophota bacterium]